MNIKYDDIIKLFSVKQENNATFKKTLQDNLNTFNLYCEKSDVSNELKIEINHICETIKEIVSFQEKGLHYTAFQKLSYLFRGTKKHSALSKDMPYSILHTGTSLYRIRINEEKKKLSYKEMFHIPLNKKGIIQTQRYSSPGYPCLYVGESIYGCWEEMHRYDFDLCMVSRLVNEKELKLLDLRVPNKQTFEDADEKILLRIPLIIACSILVKNMDDVYKPEYVVSQLITEWIINNNNYPQNKNDKIYGIRYTSSLTTEEFEFPKEKLNNIAFITLNPTSKTEFCPILSKILRITKPTCNEYEKLKCGYGIDLGVAGYANKEAEMADNYKHSDFGNLEERLSDTHKFPLMSIID